VDGRAEPGQDVSGRLQGANLSLCQRLIRGHGCTFLAQMIRAFIGPSNCVIAASFNVARRLDLR